MNKRILGNTTLEIPPLAFGGNVFGWTVNEPASFTLLDACMAAGLNFIDTADSYSRWAPGNQGGESETILGKWMKARGNRANVILATKVGSAMGEGKRDVSKAYILKAVEGSLQRLQTDYIDLYQTHWDVETTPVEETLEAYAQLVQAGKVRYIGASNLSAPRLTASLAASEARGYPRYATLQPLYNLYERESFETVYEPVCKARALHVLPYYSLASGFLTGKYRSEADLANSARGEGIKKYMTDRGMRILTALDIVSKEVASSPASVALAWLISRPLIAAPIASATSLSQLDSLVNATQITLDSTSLALLDKASAY